MIGLLAVGRGKIEYQPLRRGFGSAHVAEKPSRPGGLKVEQWMYLRGISARALHQMHGSRQSLSLT